jgi:hypothetical protein
LALYGDSAGGLGQKSCTSGYSAGVSQNSPDAPRETEPRHPVVLVFGLKPELFVGSEGRIDAFVEPPSQEQVALLVEAIGSGIEAGGHVIAIAPEWFAQDGLQRLSMAHSLLDTDRLSIHHSALPPLAAAVLASLTSAIAPYLPSVALLASLLPVLEGELHVFTWLGSVTGLSTPQPSFAQHLASLTPGSAFGVSSWPEPSVHKLSAGEPSVPLPQIVRPSRLVIAPHGGDVTWIAHTVNNALGGLDVHQVDPTPNGPKWWGTSRLVEGVVYPVDVPQLAADLMAEVEPWVCRWCRDLIASSPCPRCGNRGRPPRRRSAPPQQGARTKLAGSGGPPSVRSSRTSTRS